MKYIVVPKQSTIYPEFNNKVHKFKKLLADGSVEAITLCEIKFNKIKDGKKIPFTVDKGNDINCKHWTDVTKVHDKIVHLYYKNRNNGEIIRIMTRFKSGYYPTKKEFNYMNQIRELNKNE